MFRAFHSTYWSNAGSGSKPRPALADVAAAGVLLVPSEYPTIQAAVNAALDGDTVIVADGVYTGLGNRDITFGGKAITLKSANGPANTILDLRGRRSIPTAVSTSTARRRPRFSTASPSPTDPHPTVPSSTSSTGRAS